MRTTDSPASRDSAVVLWIEDDPDSIESCTDLLRLEGVHIESVASGMLGIAVGVARAFDLILLDLRLPDLSGQEVLHELRRAGVAAPVAVISGFLTRDASAEATRLGAIACVNKPVFCEDITPLVRSVQRGTPPAVPPASTAASNEQQSGVAALVHAIEHSRHLTNASVAISRALLVALVDPTLSTMAYGICARAFRLLCAERDFTPAMLENIMMKASVGARGNCPTIVARALADIERLAAFERSPERATVTELQPAAVRQRLKAWTGRSYRDWKRVLRIRPALDLLVATDEQIAQIAYKLGYEHASQLDHDFGEVLGVSPKLFRSLCRTHGLTSSTQCVNSHSV